MSITYYTCDVFTRERFGGNPLAVVFGADDYSTEQMQALAREFNYSETTFVLPAEQGQTAKVRIFTPKIEVPFAGHPNVGTAFTLATHSDLHWQDDKAQVVFEEKAGLVPVDIQRDAEGHIFCELLAPESLSLGKSADPHLVAKAIGLSVEQIKTDRHSPQEASVGLPFLIVEITSRAALAEASPNIDAMKALRDQGITPDIHLYTQDAGNFDLHTRMFAPLDGVQEDPATGSANCALIGLQAQLSDQTTGELRWRIAQGVDMARPSELFGRVEKSSGQVMAVRIGGYSVPVFKGTL